MGAALDRTCWRGLRIDHPYDWEIARASDQDQPGRCTFSDRHYHRLDVQWRKVQYAPNFDLILEKYRQGPEGQQRDLSSVWLASPWRGLLRQTADGFVLHAARTFPDQRTLVELTIVWPRKDRDAKLEETILKSVAIDDGEDRLWQAMGISATVPGHFNLRTNSSKVGKVSWEFATSDRGTPSRFIGLGTPKRGPVLTIERLAMPGYWLKGSIREWLVEQVPAQQRVKTGLIDFQLAPARADYQPGHDIDIC